jgi:hypothetical protein
MSKYSKKVYACPVGWNILAIGKRPERSIQCNPCSSFIYPDDMIVFDSLVEHHKGFEFKILEQAGIIQDLKHYEKFSFFDIYFDTDMNRVKWIPSADMKIYLSEYPDEQIKKTDIHLGAWHYESDFTFIQDRIKRVIEIKEINKNLISVSIKTTQGKVKIKQKSNRPFFTTQDPLSHFRKKCELMKAIYGIKVEIWAGNKIFKFDEKWRLKEVTNAHAS